MTGTLRNKPAKCCCTEICLIQSSALDSDKELTNHFNLEDAGNFSYHGAPFDAIQISASSQTATANTVHPQSPYPPRVQIEFYGDNIGSQVRIILGGAIVVQVTIGDDTADLDILDASDDSELCDTVVCAGIDRNEWHRLIACYNPDTNIVAVYLDDIADTIGVNSYESCAFFEGDMSAYAAFGTGPDHIDNVYVRNFRFWRLWYCGNGTEDCYELDEYQGMAPVRIKCFDCRCANPCEWCKNDTEFPVSAAIEIGNFSEIVCNNCPDFGGGYYIEYFQGRCAITETFELGCVVDYYYWPKFRITLTVQIHSGYELGSFLNPYFPLNGTDVDKLYLFLTVGLFQLAFEGETVDAHCWSVELDATPKSISSAFGFTLYEIGDSPGTYNGHRYFAFIPVQTIWPGSPTFYLYYESTAGVWAIHTTLGSTEPYWTSPTEIGTYIATEWFLPYTFPIRITPAVYCDEELNDHTLEYLGGCGAVYSGGLGGSWSYYEDPFWCAYDGTDATVRF